jgi:ribonuclease E
VLNHKRGHLRDLENSFKVSLAVVADATVSAQQSFVIDRGEQVHTLEAAKALLAAQVAAFPSHSEEVVDEEEPFEVEAEVETEETEGLVDAPLAGDSEGSETDADGRKRKRRRRRRGRSGEAREGAAPRDDNTIPQPGSEAEASPAGSDSESDEDETDGQPGEFRGDQPGGERRPRRRGRRGGRRRRGGPEDGPAGAGADEFAPTPVSGIATAAGDFHEPAPDRDRPAIQPEPVALQPEAQQTDHPREEPPRMPEQHETAAEAERAARRRSTVREKVSFVPEAQPSSTPAVVPANSHSGPPAPAPESEPPGQQTESGPQPRRAGWWSRRFGGGE